MTASPERGFEAPPVWEIAISSWTAAPIFDQYDTKAVHDLYRHDLPRYERQSPVLHLPIAAFAGGPPPITHMEEGVSPRWWFLSSDGHDLLQVQEQFVATNWRRLDQAPGQPFNYPGYDLVVRRARDRIDVLQHFREKNGKSFSPPSACELLYQNVIPLLDDNGERLAVSDILTEYARSEGRLKGGFQMTWMESIDGLPENDKSTMHVEISVVGVVLPDSDPLPVVKMQFIGGAVRSTWDEVFTFYDAAHAHIRHRLMVLTTDKAHRAWHPK